MEVTEEKPLVLCGGTVVCEKEVLPNHDVIIENGRISAIRPSTTCVGDELLKSAQSIIDAATDFPDCSMLADEGATFVDARGCYVLPGMVDIHSDYIESVASPRPGVVMDLASSLYTAERELVAHGVTTIYHSLSVYQAKVFDHKPIRNFENVSALIDCVRAMRPFEEQGHLIRHRLHLRVEVDAIDMYAAIKTYLKEGALDLISFMNHTPGQGQYADLQVYSSMLKGYKEITDEAVNDLIESQQKRNNLSVMQLDILSRLARQQGIAVASHDDDSLEKLDLTESLMTSISEFPITLEVAKSARERGMHTLAGAPNVVMGRSHSGNLSAREAACEGVVDILCSDYYPASMLQAAFILYREFAIDLATAFALVSINPARAVNLDAELGSIAVGKRADVLLVRELESGIPVVSQALVGGRSVYQSHYTYFDSTELDSSEVPENATVDIECATPRRR